MVVGHAVCSYLGSVSTSHSVSAHIMSGHEAAETSGANTLAANQESLVFRV